MANYQIVASLINAGTIILSEAIRTRQPNVPPVAEARFNALLEDLPEEMPGKIEIKPEMAEKPRKTKAIKVLHPPKQVIDVSLSSVESTNDIEQETETEILPAPVAATAIPTGCIPCALGHFGTCSGLLNESMRFARDGGTSSPEVIDRVNMCLDELNSMERKDLRPEMTVNLSGWEKDLSEDALKASRETRHALESFANDGSLKSLENLAANTQSTRQVIGRKWFQNKMANLTPEDKSKIQARVMSTLDRLKEISEEPENSRRRRSNG